MIQGDGLPNMKTVFAIMQLRRAKREVLMSIATFQSTVDELLVCTSKRNLADRYNISKAIKLIDGMTFTENPSLREVLPQKWILPRSSIDEECIQSYNNFMQKDEIERRIFILCCILFD